MYTQSASRHSITVTKHYMYVRNSKTYYFYSSSSTFEFFSFCFEFFNSSYHVEWNNATSTNRPPPRIFHFTLHTDISFFNRSEISVDSGRETKFRINKDQLSFLRYKNLCFVDFTFQPEIMIEIYRRCQFAITRLLQLPSVVTPLAQPSR